MSVPPQQVKLLCADATRPAADLTLFSCTPNYSVPCITVTTVEEGRVWTAHRSNELFCSLCAVLPHPVRVLLFLFYHVNKYTDTTVYRDGMVYPFTSLFYCRRSRHDER